MSFPTPAPAFQLADLTRPRQPASRRRGPTVAVVVAGLAAVAVVVLAVVTLVRPVGLVLGSTLLPGSKPVPVVPAEPARQEPPVVPVGTTLDETSADGAGTITVSAPKVAKDSLMGKKVLAVMVDVECTSGTMSYNPLFFKVKSPDGTEYSQAFADVKPSLKSSNSLPAGQKAHGYVPFEVPDPGNVSGWLVEYGVLDPVAFWRL